MILRNGNGPRVPITQNESSFPMNTSNRQVVNVAVRVPQTWATRHAVHVCRPSVLTALRVENFRPWHRSMPNIPFVAGVLPSERARLGQQLHDKLLRQVGSDLLRCADQHVAWPRIPGCAQLGHPTRVKEGRLHSGPEKRVQEPLRQAKQRLSIEHRQRRDVLPVRRGCVHSLTAIARPSPSRTTELATRGSSRKKALRPRRCTV